MSTENDPANLLANEIVAIFNDQEVKIPLALDALSTTMINIFMMCNDPGKACTAVIQKLEENTASAMLQELARMVQEHETVDEELPQPTVANDNNVIHFVKK